MPLSDYSGLKTAIESFSGAKDVSAVIDDFIDLTEADMYSCQDERGNPIGIRVRGMESRDTASTSTTDEFLALPDDYLEQRRLKLILAAGDQPLYYTAPDTLVAKTRAGRPQYYTVTSQFEFDRTSDQAYTVEIQFYKKLTALSASNTTNYILTNFPMVYLYGALYHLFVWERDLEEQQNYRQKFITAIKGANQTDRRGRRGAAPKMNHINRCLP